MKIIALGEVLIDFTFAGFSQSGRQLYEQNPGGAPANVLVAAARQGSSAGFISCVGNDIFGEALIRELQKEGVNAKEVQITDEAATTLAYVSLAENGERSFCFYRKPGADMLINKEKIDMSIIESCSIFHFGSLSLSSKSSYEAGIAAIKRAKNAGAAISFDPNWRESIWGSKSSGIEKIKEGFKYTNLLKLSEEELVLLANESNCEKGTKKLMDEYANIQLITVTLGAGGCFYRSKKGHGYAQGKKVKAIDTTGAGDTFWGCFLAKLAEGGITDTLANGKHLEEALLYANTAAALCVQKRGAFDSIPTKEQITSALGKF